MFIRSLHVYTNCEQQANVNKEWSETSAVVLKQPTLVVAWAIARLVTGLPVITSQVSSDTEKQNFLAWIEWLSVTSCSDTRTHS
jgi:hypothetical protein